MGIVGSRELRPHGRVRRTVKRASPPAIIAAAAVLIAALIFSAASCKRNAAVKPPSAGQEQSGTGIIATRPQLESSLHDFLMAEFERLGIDPARAVAKAPAGADSAVFDLSANVVFAGGEQAGEPEYIELSWTERLAGDYDQSGEVGIADITPIALNYLRNAAYRPPAEAGGLKYWPHGDPTDGGGAASGQPPAEGSGAENWRLARIDGDASGEIGISDVTPIALHYLERLDGYRVYRKGPGELTFSMLPNASSPQSPVTLSRDDATGGGEWPVRYEFSDTPPAPGVYLYRIAPYSILDEASGTVSKSIAMEFEPEPAPNNPPVWTGDGSIIASQGRDGRIIIGWEAAVDPDGDEVTYSVYYDDDPIPPTDFAGTLEEWLARAVEPVHSGFTPVYDPETETWSDHSQTPPAPLEATDPRILALNPARLTDDTELGIVRDEIPLQTITGLSQYCRLDEDDWAYAPNQPAGFPPPPGSPESYLYPLPINCAIAVPDSVTAGSLAMLGEDAALPGEEWPGFGKTEPNLRDRQEYTLLLQARDSRGLTTNGVPHTAMCNIAIAGQFDIPDGFYIRPERTVPQFDANGRLNLFVYLPPKSDYFLIEPPPYIGRIVVGNAIPQLYELLPLGGEGLSPISDWDIVSDELGKLELVVTSYEGLFEQYLELWKQNGSRFESIRLEPDGTQRTIINVSSTYSKNSDAAIAFMELNPENQFGIDEHLLYFGDRLANGSWEIQLHSSSFRANSSNSLPIFINGFGGSPNLFWPSYSEVGSEETEVVVTSVANNGVWTDEQERLILPYKNYHSGKYFEYPPKEVFYIGQAANNPIRFEYMEGKGFRQSPTPSLPSDIALRQVVPIAGMKSGMRIYNIVAYNSTSKKELNYQFTFSQLQNYSGILPSTPMTRNSYPDAWGNAFRVTEYHLWSSEGNEEIVIGTFTYYWFLL